jgi:uncharacterized protein (TIGR02145 family)
MKKLIAILSLVLISQFLRAQAPGTSYQAVIRNSTGNVLPNQAIKLRFSILDSTNGTPLYQETQNSTTNANGLVNLTIGQGTFVFGTFVWGTIDFSKNKFLKVELDINPSTGGTGNYINMGTTQMMSVPTASFAFKAKNGLPDGVQNGEMVYYDSAEFQWNKIPPGINGANLWWTGGKPTWSRPPEVITAAVSPIYTTGGTSGGYVTYENGSSVTSRGVCWSTAINPTTALSTKIVDASGGVGNFKTSITGLMANTTYHVRAFATNSVGTGYGTDLTFTTQGNIIYNPIVPSVTICDQIWMTKNLEVTSYRNGDPIPQVQDATQWSALTTGAWCYYENITDNGILYGKLYNWYAVNDPRGLAPAGWHVPSQNEMYNLTRCLGGETVAGGKMKSVTNLNPTALYWQAPNSGATNSSGFLGLPGGLRMQPQSFVLTGCYEKGYSGNWWTRYDNEEFPVSFGYRLDYNTRNFTRDTQQPFYGLSVRCLAD